MSAALNCVVSFSGMVVEAINRNLYLLILFEGKEVLVEKFKVDCTMWVIEVLASSLLFPKWDRSL